MIGLDVGTQTAESARTVIWLFAIVAAVFWKALLRIIVLVAVIVLLVLLTSGAVVLLEVINHTSG